MRRGKSSETRISAAAPSSCMASLINVEVVIGGEVRIERDPEKAAFAGGIDREAHEWCAEQ
jgi:hypothetical protein